MNRTILVTGGAGYIGSHACKALSARGFLPVTYDNLSTGWRDAVQFGPLEEGDLRDPSRLAEVIDRYAPSAVMHFAALSNVGEASDKPGLYWDNNVSGSLHLLEAMAARRVKHLVFSSTCAIYGENDGGPLDETSPQHPKNAYGASKRAMEEMIRNFAAAKGAELSWIAFRYFNVAGADPEGRIGEFHHPETHLIPLTLDACSGRRDSLTIFGQDYPTPDGTCVRDYIHVSDIVEAHVLGLEHLCNGGESAALNLGSLHGFSVREVVDTVARTVGRPVPVVLGPRRPGDCGVLLSGSTKAASLLGWQPAHSSLDKMIATAWAWHQGQGYTK